ncbi:MAG: lactate utilization protein [Phascolarctobacterium sp.]|nr:lactate utilization protein [Phascolarctobacterium sp.]
MASPVKIHNDLLGATVKANLEKRGFEAYYCENKETALVKALELIPETDVVSWGGSVSISEIGLLDAVKKRNKVIDRDNAKTPEERVEIMRQGLLCDTFLMSSNAMSKNGELVNIDGNGNRVGALCYGPKQVVMIVGLNKIMGSLENAIARAREIAAPTNVQRFPEIKTPCAKLGVCMDCNTSECVCAQIVITRRCRPAGRIKIILVGENLGF